MYHFAVNLRQEDNGRFLATLVDLPDGPNGMGATAEEAYQNLIANAADVLTKFLASGGRPAPVADEKTPTIGLSMPTHAGTPVAPPSTQAPSISKRDKGWTWNYSWRNNTVSTEG